MTNEEAELYADKMTYEEAICNVMCGYGIPYKKATKNKLARLANELKNVRSKIEKAIDTAIDKSFCTDVYNDRTNDEVIKLDDVLEILRNIGD